MTGAGGEVKSTHLIRDDFEGLYTLGPGMEKPATNSDKIRKMKHLLKVAMEISLTSRQRQVVQLFYFDGKKAQEIADEMHISKQAVYRLLKDSRMKIEKIKNIF
jgi:RNA polymerase sigma factor (sigma-70 family)